MASNTQYKINFESGLVTIADPDVILHEQHTKNYREMINIIRNIKSADKKPKDVKEYLKTMGIQFHAGSSVDLERGNITNTAAELKKIAKILNELRRPDAPRDDVTHESEPDTASPFQE